MLDQLSLKQISMLKQLLPIAITSNTSAMTSKNLINSLQLLTKRLKLLPQKDFYQTKQYNQTRSKISLTSCLRQEVIHPLVPMTQMKKKTTKRYNKIMQILQLKTMLTMLLLLPMLLMRNLPVKAGKNKVNNRNRIRV